MSSRDLWVLAGSIVVAGSVAGVLAARLNADSPRPLSKCEVTCINNFPNDTEKRLNCMLKCIADGKLAVWRVVSLSGCPGG